MAPALRLATLPFAQAQGARQPSNSSQLIPSVYALILNKKE
jgi:hypothetical protein